jgi:hypothetical protein
VIVGRRDLGDADIVLVGQLPTIAPPMSAAPSGADILVRDASRMRAPRLAPPYYPATPDITPGGAPRGEPTYAQVVEHYYARQGRS